MIRSQFLVVVILSLACHDISAAEPPTKDRTLAKEPAYKTKEPRYCQLVFGPEAKQSVWLVIDGEDLYVDRNGNGDLTEDGERVSRKPAFQGGGFEVRELTVGEAKTTYSNLVVYWTPQPPNAAKKEFTVEVLVDVNERYCQYAHFKSSATAPKEAPVIHFGGRLEMILLGGDSPLATPGKEREIVAVIGTKSATGHLATLRHDRSLSPKADVHPIAEITFPAKPGAAKPAPVKLTLNERCCNVRFFATLKTPAEVGAGKTTITLSFPGWDDAKVTPMTKTLAVAESTPEK